MINECRLLLLLSLSLAVSACGNRLANQNTVEMTTLSNPELQVSSNGMTGLVKQSDGVYRLFDLPSLDEWFNGSFEAAGEARLSSQGGCAAILHHLHEVSILSRDTAVHLRIPGGERSLATFAVSDDGQSAALLFREALYSPAAPENGRLEIWSVHEEAALAAIPVPLFDYALVQANRDITMLSYRSAQTAGSQTAGELASFDQKSRTWQVIDRTPFITAAVYGGFAVQSTPAETRIWKGGTLAKTLPGHPGNRFSFSPSGNYLLVFRTHKLIDLSQTEFSLQVVDLKTMEVVKEKLIPLEAFPDFHFIATDQAGAYYLWLDSHEKPSIKKLDM